MSNITVGIADLRVAKNPEVLVTYALGSCVGICLFDAVTQVAGLSHIMLPSSAQITNMAPQPHKFADTAIPCLIAEMRRLGANPARLKAKIAGGAQMFAGTNNSSLANIGQRNTIAVEQVLASLRIPIMAKDTGKDYGRTLYFDSATGTMRIKSVNRGEWVW